MENVLTWVWRAVTSYLFLALVGLALGLFGAFQWLPQPKVGIIKLTGDITGKSDSDRVGDMVRYARDQADIRAVVLEIDTPGGDVTATTEMYLNLLELRKEKPVVASIEGMGASGGYFVALASNFIYAKPSSLVGSIGVVSSLPPRYILLDEDSMATGPFKGPGYGREEFVRKLDLLKEAFLDTVLTHRKALLKASRQELSSGEVYLGFEGQRLGLIDGLGSNHDAIEKAASLAGIANYTLVDISKRFPAPLPFLFFFQPSLEKENLPKYQYLYRGPR